MLGRAAPSRAPAASLEDIYRRYGVPHRVDHRGRWVETHCPYCAGSSDYHLGWNVEQAYYNCFRCGWHPAAETLERLLGVRRGEAIGLATSLRVGGPPRSRARAPEPRVRISRYRRPSDVGPMRPHHLRYLERRGFDSDLIEREWGVLGTGPCAYLDGIDYRFRLLIPVVWDGREVSFQARDVTGRSDLRYASCPVDREVRHHKHILYGRQERWGRTGIVVEGVTDAWRFGPVACATFGIAYTTEQVRLIARAFERVAIVFDAERQAQERARRLAAQLHQLGNERPVVVSLGEGVDPGSMGQDDADHLVRELTR